MAKLQRQVSEGATCPHLLKAVALMFHGGRLKGSFGVLLSSAHKMFAEWINE